MAKKKIEVSMHSYGKYTKWDKKDKSLPDLIKITDKITAEIDVEFGYILEIKKAKGKVIEYRIEHPPFRDKNGHIMTPFAGEIIINSNDYKFYLGDCIWPPVSDKRGTWRLITKMDGKVIADKTLSLI